MSPHLHPPKKKGGGGGVEGIKRVRVIQWRKKRLKGGGAGKNEWNNFQFGTCGTNAVNIVTTFVLEGKKKKDWRESDLKQERWKGESIDWCVCTDFQMNHGNNFPFLFCFLFLPCSFLHATPVAFIIVYFFIWLAISFHICLKFSVSVTVSIITANSLRQSIEQDSEWAV